MANESTYLTKTIKCGVQIYTHIESLILLLMFMIYVCDGVYSFSLMKMECVIYHVQHIRLTPTIMIERTSIFCSRPTRSSTVPHNAATQGVFLRRCACYYGIHNIHSRCTIKKVIDYASKLPK